MRYRKAAVAPVPERERRDLERRSAAGVPGAREALAGHMARTWTHRTFAGVGCAWVQIPARHPHEVTLEDVAAAGLYLAPGQEVLVTSLPVRVLRVPPGAGSIKVTRVDFEGIGLGGGRTPAGWAAPSVTAGPGWAEVCALPRGRYGVARAAFRAMGHGEVAIWGRNDRGEFMLIVQAVHASLSSVDVVIEARGVLDPVLRFRAR